MKLCLIICNVVLIVLGLVLVIIGFLHIHNTSFLSGQGKAYNVAILIISTGGFLIGTAAVGIVATMLNKRWLLLIFGILLVLVHLVQSITGIFALLDTIRLDHFFRGEMTEKFQIYYTKNNTNKTIESEVNDIQHNWQCCGVLNLTGDEKVLPSSCCSGKHSNCTEELASKISCIGAGNRKLKKPLKMVSIFAIFFAVFEFFLALWTFYIAKTDTKTV